MPPPLLPVFDVREVHLDDRALRKLERVADRVAVVRPGARVDDEATGGVAELLAPLDVLAFVVGLASQDVAAEVGPPLANHPLELGQREPTVNGRIPTLEDVEVRAVQHADEHGRSLARDQLVER